MAFKKPLVSPFYGNSVSLKWLLRMCKSRNAVILTTHRGQFLAPLDDMLVIDDGGRFLWGITGRFGKKPTKPIMKVGSIESFLHMPEGFPDTLKGGAMALNMTKDGRHVLPGSEFADPRTVGEMEDSVVDSKEMAMRATEERENAIIQKKLASSDAQLISSEADTLAAEHVDLRERTKKVKEDIKLSDLDLRDARATTKINEDHKKYLLQTMKDVRDKISEGRDPDTVKDIMKDIKEHMVNFQKTKPEKKEKPETAVEIIEEKEL